MPEEMTPIACLRKEVDKSSEKRSSRVAGDWKVVEESSTRRGCSPTWIVFFFREVGTSCSVSLLLPEEQTIFYFLKSLYYFVYYLSLVMECKPLYETGYSQLPQPGT